MSSSPNKCSYSVNTVLVFLLKYQHVSFLFSSLLRTSLVSPNNNNNNDNKRLINRQYIISEHVYVYFNPFVHHTRAQNPRWNERIVVIVLENNERHAEDDKRVRTMITKISMKRFHSRLLRLHPLSSSQLAPACLYTALKETFQTKQKWKWENFSWLFKLPKP